MKKVFLGGTCNESTWRNELIPLLENAGVEYFNPVVDNWTPECQEEEYHQKEICDLHLYLITKKMKGVFSIAEAVASCQFIQKKRFIITKYSAIYILGGYLIIPHLYFMEDNQIYSIQLLENEGIIIL